MVRKAWTGVAMGLLVGVAGCTKATGAITETGYRSEAHAYRVPYANPAAQQFIDGEWQLENYRRKGRAWVQNTSQGWMAVRDFDWNSDGEVTRAEQDEEPIHDLMLTNVRDDGVIWVKVHPVHPRDAQRDLESILSGYAYSLQGSTLFEQGSLFSTVRPAALKYTTFLRDVGPATLSGLNAIIGTVESAEAAALQHNPDHRDGMVRIVFAKLVRKVPRRGGDRGPWPVEVVAGRPHWVKTNLAVVGYSNRAERFTSHLPAFDAFRQRIVFEDAIPLNEPPVRAAPPPSPPPSPEPAQVTTPSATPTGERAGPETSVTAPPTEPPTTEPATPAVPPAAQP